MLVDEGTILSISLDQLMHFLDNIKSTAWREVTSNRRRCCRDQDKYCGGMGVKGSLERQGDNSHQSLDALQLGS
jgi:hypothetical protein